MRENEKYMESISGHLAQLTNSWQEMWASAANRELINVFVDLGKAAVEAANAIGVIPSALLGFTAYTGVLKTGSKGLESNFLVNMFKNSSTFKNAQKAYNNELMNPADALFSSYRSFGGEGLDVFGETAGDIYKTTTELTKMEKVTKAGIAGFDQMKNSIKDIGSTVLGVVGIMSTALTVAIAIANHFEQIKKEQVETARATGETYLNTQNGINENIAKYEELKNKIQEGNLTEQEQIQTKQEILDIQKSINESYDGQVKGVDLVNGELEKQKAILDEIAVKEANRIWESKDFQDGFKIATEEMTKANNFTIRSFRNGQDEVDEILKQYADFQANINEEGIGDAANTYEFAFNTKDIYEAKDKVEAAIDDVEQYRQDHLGDESATEYADTMLNQLRGQAGIIEKTLQDYEQTYLQGLEIELKTNLNIENVRDITNLDGTQKTGYQIYSGYQSSISDLESAYASGNTQKIEEARQAFEKANIEKDKFLSAGDNNQFTALFDKIDTSIVDSKNRVEDLQDVLELVPQSVINDYNKAKEEGDKAYKQLGEFQKVGNVDNGDRPFIFWDDKEIKKQEKAIKSWGETAENLKGSLSTVYGGSGEFDGMEIAFTPIIKGADGQGKLLSKDTLYKYIDSLISEAGEGWTNEELLALDAKGMTVDGIQISNVIADIGDTAIQTGEKMHEWQSASIGYIGDFKDIYKEALAQGMSLDEFMSKQPQRYQKNARAVEKYASKQDEIYSSAKRIKDLNLDRVDVASVFESGASSSAYYAQALRDLMSAMGYTEDESNIFIDDLVTLGLIHGDVTDATATAADAYNQFSGTVATAIENVSKLNAVLSESVSGASISTQNIDAFKEMFGDDYAYALERSANGYHINAEKLQTLTDKQKALINADYQKTLDEQYDALKRCNDELGRMSSTDEKYSGLLSQRAGILQRIQDTKDLMMAYEASNSAYQTWINSQSNGSEFDMYDKIASGYDTVKDLIDRGWSGDDQVRSYLDLIYGSSFDAQVASGEELVEMFDKLDEKIEGTSFSIHDFFQFDKNGKIATDGIFNFFDALKEKQDQLDLDDNEKWIKDDGTYDFGFGRDREAAEALGINVELFQSMLRAGVSAGFKLNLDQPMWQMDELRDKAETAQEELEGFNKINFEELYNNLDSDDAYETISGHIDDVYSYIQTIENSDLSPEVKSERIEKAQSMLSYLVALEREAADKGDIDLKVEVADKATKQIKQLIKDTDEVPKELAEYDWDSVTDAEGLQKATDYIEGLQSSGAIDTSTAQSFLNILYKAADELEIIDNYEASPTFGNTTEAYTQINQAKKDFGDYLKTVEEMQSKGISIDFASDSQAQQLIGILTGSGTAELRTKVGVTNSKEKIYELLEEGVTDVDVLLHGDTTDLEKDAAQAASKSGGTVKTTEEHTTTNTEIDNKEYNVKASIDDSNYVERLSLNEKRLEQLDGSKAEVILDANTEPADSKREQEEQKQNEYEQKTHTSKLDVDPSSAYTKKSNLESELKAFDGESFTPVLNVDTGDSYNALSRIKGLWDSLKDKTITLTRKVFGGSGSDSINGTAHVQGTAFARGTVVSSNAFASGNWGVSKDQTALVNEVGEEIIVRDGRWFIANNGNAGFTQLQKGDVVFNSEQSKELLEKGYVTGKKRASTVGLASGTAYSSGTIKGATRSRVSTKNTGSSNKTSGGSRGSSGSRSSNSGGSNNSGNNNNKNNNKDTKETKNTLDEIEILLSRVQRRIDRLQHTIDATYNIWGNRNKAITTQLTNVSKAIKANEKAYKKYNSKANKISLPEKWKKRVRQNVEEPGKKWTEYEIRTIKNQGIWDKIQEYQQLYEKALSAKDAVLDLKDQEAELYKQRFDNTKTSYEEIIDGFQHTIDLSETLNDTLSEAGKFNSKELIQKQITAENNRIKKLNEEYKQLVNLRNKAVKSGKIKKESEAWYEMQSAINEVESSIKEANKNLITYNNSIRQIDWDVWEKTHNAIGGVINELEFLYGLINEDKMFDEQGTITNEGIAGFAILAHEYDTYFRQVQEYQNEIENTQKALNNDKNNQDLVDKLKELKEAQQDAASNAKKMKDAMVDVTEKGIKKQIDYVKKLIDDYEELLDTQKDQIDYAKKVSDQQKEINKLEKQYRAIQNDTSEEGATKRQQLKGQIDEKKEALKDTQEDRRITETKDMLSKFEESFEDFLNKKLEDIEGIVREVVDATNNSKDVISTTLTDLATSYGYTISDTLQSSIDKMDNNLVSYFSNKGDFENAKVTSIAEGVDAIVKYFTNAQKQSEPSTTASKTASKTTAKTTSKASSTASKSTTPTVAEAKTNVKAIQDIVKEAEHALTTAQDNLKVAEKKKNKEAINNALKGVSNASVKLNTANQNLAKATETLAKAESAAQTKANTKTSASKSKASTTTATKSVTPTAQKAAQDKAKVEAAKAKTEAANMAAKIKQTGTHIQSYKNSAGKTVQGYFKDDGTLNASYTGWAKKGNKMYRFEKGKLVSNKWITVSGKKYYIGKDGARVTGKQTINKIKYTFDNNGVYKKKGWKKGTASVPKTDLAWTNEGRKAEAIIRKSDGAILTPLSKGDSVIPSSAMKNMYRALIDPEKYLKQYTTPDIKIVQTKESGNSSPATINMQFIANGVQDANKFANDLMNNKKIEKWIQEITLGQANGNNSYRKYSYAIR